jgi:hypothetical protein
VIGRSAPIAPAWVEYPAPAPADRGPRRAARAARAAIPWTMPERSTLSIDVTIKSHPTAPDSHSLCIVTTRRGRRYFVTWAGVPTEEPVRAAWHDDRPDFQPDNSLMWAGLHRGFLRGH